MVNPTGYTALDMIGFTDQGAYSSSDNYVKNDLVHYSGNIWRCLIDDTSGIAPAEGVNWTLFIGEPTNLVERIIAPVETDPATNAWTVGRQIIFNDNLYEVISAITAGDSLVTYEDDPTNANIKLADPVETQLLNVKGNLSNRNLLDNAWFTVNQRGQSSYNAGYTVDRWYILDPHGAITPSSNGLIFTATDSTVDLTVRQYIEIPDSMLNGKPITLSIELSDGTIISETVIYNSNNSPIIRVSNSLIQAVLYNYPTINGQFINLSKLKGDTLSATIRAIKLELGSISTLAMDTAPNYQQELAKCQRYFYRLKSVNANTNDIYTFGCATSTTQVQGIINFPTTLRTTPSIVKSGAHQAYDSESTASQAITSFSFQGFHGNSIVILANVASGLEQGKSYAVQAINDANAYIDFSADL